jgi:hypothetical protein
LNKNISTQIETEEVSPNNEASQMPKIISVEVISPDHSIFQDPKIQQIIKEINNN